MVGLFTLEESYVVRGSRFLWLSSKLRGGHMSPTIQLLRFFKKMVRNGCKDVSEEESKEG